jgi:ribulose-phosphate 3-epimerase
VQIDICDGKFVPSTTWPYKKHDENYEAILREERGMPAWEDIDYEFDLMIDLKSSTEDTLKTFGEWVKAGAERIVIHIESTTTENLERIIQEYGSVVEIGIAMNHGTSIDTIEQFVEHILFIQCMGIRRIGYQGQDFDVRVLEKVREVKKKWPDMLVSIDGGVSPETVTALREAGADRLVAGSAIFESEHAENVNEAIYALK